MDQIWEKCYVSDDVKTTFYTVLESKDDQKAILTHYEAHLGTIHKPGGQIIGVLLTPFRPFPCVTTNFLHPLIVLGAGHAQFKICPSTLLFSSKAKNMIVLFDLIGDFGGHNVRTSYKLN